MSNNYEVFFILISPFVIYYIFLIIRQLLCFHNYKTINYSHSIFECIKCQNIEKSLDCVLIYENDL